MNSKNLSIIFLLVVQLFANNPNKEIDNNVLEVFFDTPTLYLLKHDLSLKYQAEQYISKKKKKKKYHELIIYNSLDQKKHTFKVKHYKNVESMEEKHPLLSMIKRKDRKFFMDMLQKDGIEYPMKLKYIFENVEKSTNENNVSNTYQSLFKQKNDSNLFFRIKFQYPYYVDLFYAICFGLLGYIFIRIVFYKRLKKGDNK